MKQQDWVVKKATDVLGSLPHIPHTASGIPPEEWLFLC